MAPKPALFDPARAAVDSEQSILEASETGGATQLLEHKLATMNFDNVDVEDTGYDDEPEEDVDEEASSAPSDYTGDDGEESETASRSRRGHRSHSSNGRRSKHRGSSRRRKHRHKSRSSSRGGGGGGDDEYDDTTVASDVESHRSSSRAPQPDEDVEPAAVIPASVPSGSSTTAPKSGKTNPQPFVKLLNFQTLYRTEQDRCPLFTEELEKVTEHWSVCKEILNRLTDEVRHANHLFHVSDVSFHQVFFFLGLCLVKGIKTCPFQISLNFFFFYLLPQSILMSCTRSTRTFFWMTKGNVS